MGWFMRQSHNREQKVKGESNRPNHYGQQTQIGYARMTAKRDEEKGYRREPGGRGECRMIQLPFIPKKLGEIVEAFGNVETM